MKPLNTRTRIQAELYPVVQPVRHFALVISSNSTEDRSGLTVKVVRREFYRTAAEAAAQVGRYIRQEDRVNPTGIQAEGLFPTDGAHGPYLAFTFQVWEMKPISIWIGGVYESARVFVEGGDLEIHELVAFQE